jgi:apolipoprotein N-acyltransferase
MPASIEVRKRRLELTGWAFLLSLSFYPGGFGFLAWFSLARPFFIISRLSGKDAFRASYFFAFLFNLFSLYWIGMVTPPGTLAIIVIVAFYYTAILVVFNKLYRLRPILGSVALPFLWVGLEYFRTLSEFAFPWSDLGYTQSYYLYMMQIVSIISVHGLSLLMVIANVFLFQILRTRLQPARRLTALFLSLGIVLGLTAYGWIVIPAYPSPGDYKVAMLQGAVPIETKWQVDNQEYSYQLYDSLTKSVDDTTVNLYIWPETSAPCYLSHNRAAQRRLFDIATQSGRPHLVGALGVRGESGRTKAYNSCFQLYPEGGEMTRYDKVKLVPFSEHVPYQDYLPFLQKGALKEYLTFIDMWGVQWWSDFYPGDSAVVFDLPDARYAVQICFESTFPEYVRQTVLDGADFLVGITNDTWFGESVGIHMHSRIFLSRCIENRIWGARIANSGITYIVDGFGRIREELDIGAVGVLKGDLKILEEYSVFTRYGDLAGRLSLLITISLMGILLTIWILGKFGFGSLS